MFSALFARMSAFLTALFAAFAAPEPVRVVTHRRGAQMIEYVLLGLVAVGAFFLIQQLFGDLIGDIFGQLRSALT